MISISHRDLASISRRSCILKAAQGEYGRHTHIVRSKADVRAIATSGFGTEWVLQELVLGPLEYSTSILIKVRNGM